MKTWKNVFFKLLVPFVVFMYKAIRENRNFFLCWLNRDNKISKKSYLE